MFENLLVVELASVLAGPLTGTFFAEMGAEVIKIENKITNGDVTRTWRLPSEKPLNQSAYYSSANYNKQVVFLNLTEDDDYNRLFELVEKADIVIANYRESAAKKLKVDYQTIKKINTQIIYGNIIGYRHQPNRPAFDVVLQAETGFMYMNGQPDSPPTKMPVALIDVLAAHQLKQGLLTALWQREKTGKGCKVSVSLFEAAIASLVNQASNWLMAEHIPQRMGSLHPNIAPYGEMFETKDKQLIVLAIGNSKQFNTMCQILELVKLNKDERFASNENRVKNRNALTEILLPAFKKFNSDFLMQEFLVNNVPAGIVKNMQQVFTNDITQNLVLSEKVEGYLTKRVKSTVFKLEQ